MSTSRDTIFAERNYKELFPIKHCIKRHVNIIAKKTGIVFNDSGERSIYPKLKARSASCRTLIPGDEFRPNIAVSSVGKGQFQKNMLATSHIATERGYGQESAKKRISRPQNDMQLLHFDPWAVTPEKTASQHKLDRVDRYMNSNQMKDIFKLDHDKYYRGVIPVNKL